MFKSRWKKAMKARAKEAAIFKLEFHASQVPQQGWNKLLVSLVSLDTGKVTAKTGNAPVTKGTCQWSEPLFGSVHVSRYFNGKDAGKELYKLVVSMGLSRFGILGVATINLMDYMLATTPVSLPLPLEGCSFGSILHVKIQRIMGMSTSRDQKEVHLDQDLQLATSDGGQQTKFELMLSGNNVADSGQGKPSIENKDDASVLSTARHSFNSVDVLSTPGVSESFFYDRDGLGEDEFMLLSSSVSSSGRHEAGSGFHDNNQEFTLPEMLVKPGTSVDSYSSSPYHSKCSPDGHNGQNQESISHEWGFPGNSSCSSHGIESYNDESRRETSQRWTHLHSTGSVAIAASWEGDGNQLVVAEIDALKLQLANETKRSKEVHKKLSVVMAERDSIKQEMENLKSLEKSPSSNTWKGGLKWHQQVQEDTSRHAVEFQDELDYEKSLNSSLSFQLQKTQESNSELLLEIQDLEKLLQENKLQKTVNENKPESGNGRIEDTDKDPTKLVDTLQKELEELKRDSQKLTAENLDLLMQLKQVTEKMKDKDDIIAQLEIKSTHINKASIADYIQVMGGLKAERVELGRETSVFLEAREAADSSGSQFQTLNAMLQEQLHQEQLKISKIFQQSKEHEAKSSQRYQAFNVAQAQVNSMEQIIELETARKEIECDIGRDFGGVSIWMVTKGAYRLRSAQF